MEINKTVFVIIVTYNGKEWYDRCFDSVAKSSIPVRTIVVDNASSDGTVEFIKKYYPDIILIQSDKNLGFGQANNLGIKYALSHNCDYVFLLNQDTWIESDTIEKLIDCHTKNTEYGILSPIHMAPDKEHFEAGLLDYLTNNKITDRKFWEDIFFNRTGLVYDSNYINAAAWLLPQKTLVTVGGFDPIYFHYEEDDDYINRVLYHGLKIGIVPSASIVHDHRTENHPNSKKKQIFHHQQSLLVHFTDLNKNESISKYIAYCFRKVVKNSLCGRFDSVRYYLNDISFLLKKKKRIFKSRQLNSKSAPTWL